MLDFPVGTVDKNPPANEGHTEFDPWFRKIPHATGQLSPCTATIEPLCLEPVLCNKRSHRHEKPTRHNEE